MSPQPKMAEEPKALWAKPQLSNEAPSLRSARDFYASLDPETRERLAKILGGIQSLNAASDTYAQTPGGEPINTPNPDPSEDKINRHKEDLEG